MHIARKWGEITWRFAFSNLTICAEQRLAIVEIVLSTGMILSGVVLGMWGGFKSKSRTMALSLFLFSIGAIGLGSVSSFLVYSACIFIAGFAFPFYTASKTSIIQTSVESEYLGRVFSVQLMITSVWAPLGMLVWGPLGDIVNIEYLMIGTGAFLFAFSFVLFFVKAFAGRQ